MSWAHKRTSQPPWGDNVGLSWGLDHCASLIGDGHHWPSSDDDLAIRVQSTHITTINRSYAWESPTVSWYIIFGLGDRRPTSNDAAIIMVPVHSLMIWLNVYLYHSLQRLRVQTMERSFNPPDNYKHTHISLHTRAFVPLVSLLLYQAQTQTKNSLASASTHMQKTNPKTKSKTNPDNTPKRSRHLVICSSVASPVPRKEQRQTK